MFVCYPYPRKVMQFLQRTSVRIEESDPGIYRFRLWCIDAAIIVQSRLDSTEYLLIRENKIPQIDGTIYSASSETMFSMDASLASLVREGRITKEEALAHASNPEMLKRRL